MKLALLFMTGVTLLGGLSWSIPTQAQNRHRVWPRNGLSAMGKTCQLNGR